MRHLTKVVYAIPLVLLVLLSILLWLAVVDVRQFDVLFSVIVAFASWGLLRRFGVNRLVSVALSLLLIFASVGANVLFSDIRLAPYLAIALVNAGVGVIFARGLLPGRTPIILQLVRMMGRAAADQGDFVRFVRGQCWLWSVLSLATGLAAGLAMVWPESRTVLDAVVAGLLAFQIMWFVLSHRYAAWRYGRPETWAATIHAMTRPDTWTVLEI